jgi:hypothetical protein
MLDDKVGIYALRLLYLDNSKNDPKNDKFKCGPENIDFDRHTREFTVLIETPEPCNGFEKKLMEYYVRNNPDSISYKKQNRDKLNLKHVDLILKYYNINIRRTPVV